MNDLERLKKFTKLLALFGIIIFEKKLVEMVIPKDPILIRKLLIVGGTAMLACLSGEIIFVRIDKHFNKIIYQVEADAIGMVS